MVSNQIASAAQELAHGSENQFIATEDISKNTIKIANNINTIKEEITSVAQTAEETTSLSHDGRNKMNDLILQIKVIKDKVDYSASVKRNGRRSSKQY